MNEWRLFEVLKALGYIIFLCFVIEVLIVSYKSPIEIIDYISVMVSIVFYLYGTASLRSDVVSAAWLMVGCNLILTLVIMTPISGSLSVMLTTTLLIASYEYNRFLVTVSATAPRKSESLSESVFRRYRHAYFTRYFQVIGITFAVSVAIALLSRLFPVSYFSFEATVAFATGILIFTLLLIWRIR
jgi:hypothetical protein